LISIYKWIFPPLFIPLAGIKYSDNSLVFSDSKSSETISAIPISMSLPVASSLSLICNDGFLHNEYNIKLWSQTGVNELSITFVFTLNSWSFNLILLYGSVFPIKSTLGIS